MVMKAIILISSILITTASNASFNRVWVGHKKRDVTTTYFLNGLNKTFFKDTISVGKGRGLISYQPYVTQMNSNVPDELALVIYKSKEKYRQIRSTPEGERYSALHWDYFEKDISKSTVSVPFEGKLVEGQAVELRPTFQNWQQGFTHVAIYAAPSDLQHLASAFEKLKKNSDVNNAILLVTPKWIIEYRSLKTKSAKYIKLPLKLLETHQLTNSSLESLKESVGFGEGVNFNF